MISEPLILAFLSNEGIGNEGVIVESILSESFIPTGGESPFRTHPHNYNEILSQFILVHEIIHLTVVRFPTSVVKMISYPRRF